MSLAALPEVGETIDRYQVVAEIARGGMAAVYAVQRTGIGGFEKLLALKIMLPHLASEPHFVQMFLDEARLASHVQHPNVCPVLDVGQRGEVPFLLMDLVKGRSLAATNARAKTHDAALPGLDGFWLEVLAQTAEGLHAAHEARGPDGASLGIVHRDVSPQNVLIGFDGRVRVVDFGIAAGRGRLVGTRTGEIKGKFAYLAPEQVSRDRPVGPAVDVWALGVVAWELFARRRLFADDEEAKALWNVMSMTIPDLGREAPQLPREVARVIMGCLERDPARRPESALDVARALRAAAPSAGDGRADLAQTLDALFATDRQREEASLREASASLRAGSAPRGASLVTATTLAGRAGSAGGEPETRVTAVVSPRGAAAQGAGRRVVVWGLVAAGGLVVGVAAWRIAASPAGATSEGVAESPPVTTSVAGAPPVETVASDAAPDAERASVVEAAAGDTPTRAGSDPAKIELRIEIGEGVRLVLVDGVRHTERPVELALAEGQTAVVELLGVDGRTAEHRVTAADEGRVLALPPKGAKAAPPSAGTGAGTGASPAPQKSAPLLPNPF